MMNSVKKDMSSCLFSFVINCCSLELLSKVGLAEIKITFFIEFFLSLPVQIEVL